MIGKNGLSIPKMAEGAQAVSRLQRAIGRRVLRVFDLRYGSFFWGVYSMTRASGFFSEMSTALLEISRLGRCVSSIDSSRALNWFKSDPGQDLFAEIFEAPRRRVKKSKYLSKSLHHHSVYCRLPFEEINPTVRNWFSPSEQTKARGIKLSQTFGVTPGKMLAVNLRGSQKHKEVDPTPIADWVEAVSQLQKANRGLTVSVFSDDQDLVDEFVSLATFEVIDFAQRIRTRGGSSIASAFRDHAESTEATKDFVGQTWLISQARIVVTHTGNTAYWTSLFRECHWGLFQFTAKPGHLAFSAVPCEKHSAHAEVSPSVNSTESLRLVPINLFDGH